MLYDKLNLLQRIHGQGECMLILLTLDLERVNRILLPRES